MARPLKLTDLPEATKKFSREAFVGNECDTDEYRESQPEKGLGMISALVHILSEQTEARSHELDETIIDGLSRREILVKVFELSAKWINLATGSYEGANELTSILEIYHDVLWARGEHPYYGDDVDEFLESYEDDLDGEGNLKHEDN